MDLDPLSNEAESCAGSNRFLRMNNCTFVHSWLACRVDIFQLFTAQLNFNFNRPLSYFYLSVRSHSNNAMGSVVLPHLPTGWHVGQVIMSEGDRLHVIRFGRD